MQHAYGSITELSAAVMNHYIQGFVGKFYSLVARAVLGSAKAFFVGKTKKKNNRIRLPRHFGEDRVLTVYNQYSARGQLILRSVFPYKRRSLFYVYHVNLPQKNIFLLTNKTISLLTSAGVGWNINWTFNLQELTLLGLKGPTIVEVTIKRDSFIKKSIQCENEKDASDIYSKLSQIRMDTLLNLKPAPFFPVGILNPQDVAFLGSK
eukprot:TRINITY_DN7752_c0_g4_i2.p1 TRINITY_DN7752_c0_g4~~TRINITY_DN7752_c0_g4_i2.p1  ORF type:complete len:207 (+),score=15.93 TRINITY_DN7752_c0_g4_i2:209-829(+)